MASPWPRSATIGLVRGLAAGRPPAERSTGHFRGSHGFHSGGTGASCGRRRKDRHLVTIGDKVTTPWIRRFKPTDIGYVRLVCFPHAGGSASYFNQVSARFSRGVDVVALQYPGRQDRRHERCVADLGVLADLITGELLTLSD